MTPVGFGIVGCGGIGLWHARQLLHLPGARLVAMADPAAAARERAAARTKVPIHKAAAALFADPDVEVVSICTPPASHADLARSAAAAGKHVLVEKPLALDSTEAGAIIAACVDHRRSLGVVHQQRAQAACIALKRLVEEGELGAIACATGTLCWFRSPAELREHAWRGRDPGGGLLLDAGVHLVDLMLWLLGPAAWVVAGGAGAHASGAHETVAGAIRFETGALGTLAMTFAGNAFRDDIVLEVVGTRGTCRLEIRDFDHAVLTRLDLAATADQRATAHSAREAWTRVAAAGGTWRDGPRHPLWRAAQFVLPRERGRFGFRSPISYLQREVDRRAQRERGEPQAHAAVLACMADAVRGRGEPIATGRDALAALRVLEALDASARRGGARLPLVQEPTAA